MQYTACPKTYPLLLMIMAVHLSVSTLLFRSSLDSYLLFATPVYCFLTDMLSCFTFLRHAPPARVPMHQHFSHPLLFARRRYQAVVNGYNPVKEGAPSRNRQVSDWPSQWLRPVDTPCDQACEPAAKCASCVSYIRLPLFIADLRTTLVGECICWVLPYVVRGYFKCYHQRLLGFPSWGTAAFFETSRLGARLTLEF